MIAIPDSEEFSAAVGRLLAVDQEPIATDIAIVIGHVALLLGIDMGQPDDAYRSGSEGA